jgi:hypothetical protein
MAQVTRAVLEQVLSLALEAAQHADVTLHLRERDDGTVTITITLENGDRYEVQVSKENG